MGTAHPPYLGRTVRSPCCGNGEHTPWHRHLHRSVPPPVGIQHHSLQLSEALARGVINKLAEVPSGSFEHRRQDRTRRHSGGRARASTSPSSLEPSGASLSTLKLFQADASGTGSLSRAVVSKPSGSFGSDDLLQTYPSLASPSRLDDRGTVVKPAAGKPEGKREPTHCRALAEISGQV